MDRLSTQKVAEFVVGVDFDHLPTDVVNKIKRAVLDNLGVSIRAHRDKAVEATRRVAMAMGGKEESTLIGIGTKVPCNVAAWVNAVMGSTLDMDDGAMIPGGHAGHPGGIIVPSALSVAEKVNATAKQLIEALATGFEVNIRTGMTLGGISLEGTSGAYGAAAVAAKLMKLDIEEVVNAIAIAEEHAPHVRLDTLMLFPAMTKEGQGWGAMTGVSAALLAQAGFAGPRTIFDQSQFNKEAWDSIGKEWTLMGLYIKPYSACRCSHTSIDGILELVETYSLTANDIKTITIGGSEIQFPMANPSPANVYEAHYSIPFLVGAVLVYGDVGPDQVSEEMLCDKAIFAQIEKVKIIPDREVEALGWDSFSARVEVETRDGKRFQTLRTYAKGVPEYPMTQEECDAKFNKLATKIIGPDRAEDVFKCVDELEKLSSVRELIARISNFD